MDGGKGATIVKGNIADNYRRLFVNAHGKIMATSSKLGQTSGCAYYQDGSDAGGIYSSFFWNVLLKYCEETTLPTWNNIINTTKSEVAKFTKQEQIPDGVLDVIGDAGSVSNAGSVPSPPVPSNTPSNATTSSLSQALSLLLATNDTDMRLSCVNNILQSHFNGGGTIVTVGRNLKTVVEYETAVTFLRRIATNKNVLRINIIKEETDINGRPYITVHEMRKGY